MLHIDPATGMLSVPVWLSAAVAAVVVVLAILAVARSGIAKTLFALAVLTVIGYGAWMGWQVFERTEIADRVEARRDFERRVAELTGRATVPGSPLSCLDGATIEQLTSGCEAVLFGSPENVTAAVSYVAARLALLGEGLNQAAQSDQNFDGALNALRIALEADRFGIVAHVMGQQPNCLPEQCEILALLHDANRVRANLQEKPFEALVAKHSPQWSLVARAEGMRLPAAVVPGGAPPAPISSRYELPSAASIPPVSIMNSETSSTPPPPAPSASSSGSSTPPTPRRPPAIRAPVARSAQPEPQPVPLAPAGTGGPAPAPVNPPGR